MQVLPGYLEHMKKNPNSLLCRLLALCRIKPNKSYLLVMGNIHGTSREIHEVRHTSPVYASSVRVCVCILIPQS